MERVIIKTSGRNALEDARASLQEHDLSVENVTSVSIEIGVESSTQEQVTEEDDNREFRPVNPDTKRFRILKAVAQHPGSTNRELNDVFDDINEVSPQTHALHENKLVNREGPRPYVYEPTEYGLALLREHGVDV